ncbi:MAG: lasso peptide biosynthesis B2 protein [Gemmatimonadetes bacterium]|nr:lasso peptide biosynthesis B2 protein [Gemmatimonadota bacterium]
MSAWRTFGRLTWADRRLLAEAALCLAVARLSVLSIPFRRLSRRLGAHGRESSTAAPSVPTLRVLRDVVWSLQATSRRLPWRCACIEQGIAGKMMLRRRSIASTLYLGVAREREAGSHATAHAWLRSGPLVITGAAERERYTVVATFADE